MDKTIIWFQEKKDIHADHMLNMSKKKANKQ